MEERHTQCWPDDFAMTRILIGAALEADGENGEVDHFVCIYVYIYISV